MGICIELNNFDVSHRLIFLKTRIEYGAPNYPAMLDELINEHDMTMEKIAYLLPVSGGSIVSAWCTGVTPNYEAGEAFLELWKTVTNKTDQDIPRSKKWSI